MELQFKAKDFRRIARDKLSGHWWMSLAVTLVASMLGAFGSGFNVPGLSGSGYTLEDSDLGGILNGELPSEIMEILQSQLFVGIMVGAITVSMAIAIALFFVGSPMLLGHDRYYIGLCNNENPQFNVLFSRFKYFWKAVGLRAFMALFVFLWLLLFIIPGIIAAYRYSMAPYLMAQYPDMGVREAVDRSKQLMMGHKGRLFCLELSFIGWALLCVLTLGIGYLFLAPYVQASAAAFYLDRTGQGIPLNPGAPDGTRA